MSIADEQVRLEGLRDRVLRAGVEALGGPGKSFYILDFVMIGAVKRTLGLASGLISMVKARNMTCSRALVRMHLDTVSRLLAYAYVDDPEATASAVIGGTPLKKFKSKDGNPLTDAYLVKRLSSDHPWVAAVYKFTSGYVHFSERQFFDAVHSTGSREDGMVQFQIAESDPKFPDGSWEEILACFSHLLEIQAEFLTDYGRSKADL